MVDVLNGSGGDLVFNVAISENSAEGRVIFDFKSVIKENQGIVSREPLTDGTIMIVRYLYWL